MISSSATGPAQSTASTPALRKPSLIENALPAIVLVMGFVARLIPAARLFLNPDEALHSSVPPGSVLLADYESGLLLGYYVCPQGVVRIFPSSEEFAISDCEPYRVLSPTFREWKFVADTFPGQFANATALIQAQTPSSTSQSRSDRASTPQLWLFYAGWINDSSPAMKHELAAFGCPTPRSFGENIFFCQLTAPANLPASKKPPSEEGGP